MAKKNNTVTTLKMVGEEVLITPDLAKQFLLTNVPENRNVSAKHVHDMCLDMMKGTWERSPQPICFDTEGRLIDGQHRLHALVAANVPQMMMVVRNCPPACMDHIDCGRRRSICDRIKIGYPDLHWISPKVTSICNILSYCWRHMMPTQDEKAQYMQQHKDSIMWILRNYRALGHGFEKAPIRAAIMIAYENGINEKLLIDLCDILADPGSVAASGALADQNFHQLRSYLLSRAIRFNAGGGENKTVFCIVGDVIHQTVQKKKLEVENLDKVNKFPFPVVGVDNEEVYTPNKFSPLKVRKAAAKKKKKSEAKEIC